MSSSNSAPQDQPIPVLLLKTKSSPFDAYEDLFSAPSHNPSFEPTFVPVLQHKFEEKGVDRLRNLLRQKRIGSSPDCEFGGLIFTSQRAVEAFAHVVLEDEAAKAHPHLQRGPSHHPRPVRRLPAAPSKSLAATRATAMPSRNSSSTTTPSGTAETIPPDCPLLFLVGEQRRDIIPRTLMGPSLPETRRIPVVEEVVYGTGEMPSFPDDFAAVLRSTQRCPERWAVVFSPTGCDSMLRGLSVLDPETGKFSGRRDEGTYVATIGPTTRTHLVKNFDFEPDVCAETPTPEGILEGIVAFQKKRLEKTAL
ncbi:hypothetical protein TrVFT333_003774 [Trichoderma virens FT-333]|nr:hypothetical protein TrVFT333_003774 [Trichoderma virens FT-333]